MVRRVGGIPRRSRPAGAQHSSVRFFRWFRCAAPPANFLRASGTKGTRGRERGRDRTKMSKLQGNLLSLTRQKVAAAAAVGRNSAVVVIDRKAVVARGRWNAAFMPFHRAPSGRLNGGQLSPAVQDFQRESDDLFQSPSVADRGVPEVSGCSGANRLAVRRRELASANCLLSFPAPPHRRRRVPPTDNLGGPAIAQIRQSACNANNSVPNASLVERFTNAHN